METPGCPAGSQRRRRWVELGGAAGPGHRHAGEALPECPSLGQAEKTPVPGQMLVKNQRRLPMGTIYISFQTWC